MSYFVLGSSRDFSLGHRGLTEHRSARPRATHRVQPTWAVSIQARNAAFSIGIALLLSVVSPLLSCATVQAQVDCVTPSAPPTICIFDTTVVEGQRGFFTITLSAPTVQFVEVFYTMDSVSATDGQDFTGRTDSFVFPTGTTSIQLHVDTIDDALVEGPETFRVRIVSASNVTIGDGAATGTITDNDGGAPPPAPITVSVDDATVPEGDATVGPELQFDVKLSRKPVPGEVINVDFQTFENTAKSGQDYISRIGTLTFNGNDPNVSAVQSVFVQAVGDQAFESPKNETFFFRLTAARGGATITDNEAIGTIIDDDTLPVVTINRGGRIFEGSNGPRAEIFTLSLTNASGRNIGSPFDALTVQYTTAGQTAVGGASCPTNPLNASVDFIQTTGTIIFAKNEFQRSFKIDICGDTVDEPNLTFAVIISTNQATIGRGQANVTIVNDDTPPPPAPKPANKSTIGSNGIGVKVTGQLVSPAQGSNEGVFKTKSGQFVSNIGRSALEGRSLIISNDGASIIGNDGASLITNDGGSLITNDGGSLITNDGGSIISNDGASLITNDGGS